MIGIPQRIEINTQNMPPCLSERYFEDWICRFARLGQNFGFDDISALIPTLTVSFSTARKTKTYGYYSMQEAKEKIKDLFPDDAELQGWLEDRLASIKKREELWNAAEELAFGPNRWAEYDGRAVYEGIQKIASAVRFTQWILGEYLPGKREIVLYTNNILQTRGNKTSEQAFEEVFAHELFHAYHYFWLHDQKNDIKDADILKRTDRTHEVVVESLAAYYENAYCAEYKIPTDLWDEWRRNRPSIYPYAGASYIRSEREFREILEVSSDLDAALRKLLYKNDEGRNQFYEIKEDTAPAKSTTKIRIVKAALCPREYIKDAIVHCRTQLNADPASSQSTHYFNTKKMREFFKRHGEEIGNKLRIVCQPEGKRINIYLEGNARQGISPALDLLRADSGIGALCKPDRHGRDFTCLISRVKVIDLDEPTDTATGKPRPFSAIAPTIDANLQEFQKKLSALEDILDRL